MNRRSFLQAFSFLAAAPVVAAELLATTDPQKKMALWREASSAEFNDINSYFASSKDSFQKAIYDHIWRENPYIDLLKGGAFPKNMA